MRFMKQFCKYYSVKSFDDAAAYSLSCTVWTELRPNKGIPERENMFEQCNESAGCHSD